MRQNRTSSLDEYLKFQYIAGIIYPPVLYTFIQMLITVVGTWYYSIQYSKHVKNVTAMQAYGFAENVNAYILEHSYVMSAWAAFFGCIVFLYIFYKDCKRNQQKFLNEQLKEVKTYRLGYPIVFAIAGNLGLSRLMSLLPKSASMTQYQESSQALMSGSLLIQLLTIAVLVPIVEEVIYRGLVYKRSLRYLTPRQAMVFSALVFGIFHFNVIQGVYAFILGLAFAYVYHKYQNLNYCILMHAFANGTAVIMQYFSVSNFINRYILLYAIVMVLELTVAGCCLYGLVKDKNEIIDV
jgi:membrane protease YdiL (CAAX protease family)